jgi:hypothetical protein
LSGECDIEICGRNTLVLRAGTTDGWSFTATGDIGPLVYYTTVPNGVHYKPFPTWIDTDQFDTVQVYELGDPNYLYYITFVTDSSWEYSTSTGPFTLNDVSVPFYCHSTTTSKCSWRLPKWATEITIVAETSDAWAFTIEGDVGDLVSYETVSPGTHYEPFPTRMDTDQYDKKQVYKLKKCYTLYFKTVTHASGGTFTIDGFGDVPKSCHSSITSQCHIEVCNRETLVIRAETADSWGFTIYGDIGDLIAYETVSSGIHYAPFPTLIDTDQFDHIQVYELIKGGKKQQTHQQLIQQLIQQPSLQSVCS